MFNSCGVCAHIVAVATRKKCFDTFVNWLRKWGSMNITKMAHLGLPKGAGKKGHSHRKFSTKSSSRNVKIFHDADSESYTPPDLESLQSLMEVCAIELVYNHLLLATVRQIFTSHLIQFRTLPIQQPPLPASPLALPHDPPIAPPLTSPVAPPNGPPIAPPPAPPLYFLTSRLVVILLTLCMALPHCSQLPLRIVCTVNSHQELHHFQHHHP